MHRNCYPRASSQKSDTAVGFGQPHFLYCTDILEIGGHEKCDLDIDSLTLSICSDMIQICTRFSVTDISYTQKVV